MTPPRHGVAPNSCVGGAETGDSAGERDVDAMELQLASVRLSELRSRILDSFEAKDVGAKIGDSVCDGVAFESGLPLAPVRTFTEQASLLEPLPRVAGGGQIADCQ